MPDINDYAVYNDRMRRSMWDKSFFMDKVPGTEAVIDYGCADGSLVRFLSGLFPSMRFIGFDIDPVMIRAADAQRRENTWFFDDPDRVVDKLRELGIQGGGTAVNFSSVFHEVFHYGFDTGVIRRLIRAVDPGYLVVRDMMYQSPDDGAVLTPEAEERAKRVLPARPVRDFEAVFGPIRLRKNLIHLLMKIGYPENWDRECAENYFSFTEDDLTAVLDPDGRYRRLFFTRYTLPWIRLAAERDFGLDMGTEATTHFALILGKKPNPPCVSLDAGASHS